jgi:hypothetical protein
VAAGRGRDVAPSRERPRPARTPAGDLVAVAERKARAAEEPLDVRVRSSRPFLLLEVRNALRETHYLVMLPEFPDRGSALCTCTDFARRGLGTCKHIEAALRWLPEHPERPPDAGARGVRTGPVWKRIDLRLEASGRAPGTASRRWRAPGAALFDYEKGR